MPHHTFQIVLEIGANGLYIAMNVFLFVLSGLTILWAKKAKPENVHKFIIVLLFINFALHFLKIFLPSYFGDLPFSLKKISPDNICAVSVIFFPFMYLWGGKYLKDYMVYLGIISGFGVYLVPSSYNGYVINNLETIVEITRFYFCHMPLVIAPLAMLASGLHQLNHRRAFVSPLIFLAVLTLVGLNEVFLKLSGITNASWQDVFSNNYRNGAMVFGPMSVLDDSLGGLYWLILPFLKYTWPGSQSVYYIPVLWVALPAFIIMGSGFFLISLPWSHREAYLDYHVLRQKTIMWWKARSRIKYGQ
ncbi:MAG: hypothetical protein EOM77_02000 [Bacteroidia bacterium]|nr:hypothetical protein [Bacteroidia bacterium]